jgi:hypothetical protein
MQRLARPVAPREEAEHDPSGVLQSGFAPLLHTDPRLPALSFAYALLTDYRGGLLGENSVLGTAGTIADDEHQFIVGYLGFGPNMGNVIRSISNLNASELTTSRTLVSLL